MQTLHSKIRRLLSDTAAVNPDWFSKLSDKKKKEYLAAHPHSALIKEIGDIASDHSGAPPTPEYAKALHSSTTWGDKHYKDKTKQFRHDVTLKAKNHDPKANHVWNAKKSKQFEEATKRHGFVQHKEFPHIFDHPDTKARVYIHHPSDEFYTDKYAGFSLVSPHHEKR